MLGNLFGRQFNSGLVKTRTSLGQRLKEAFTRRSVIDDSLYEDLEEVLIQADVGVPTTMALVSALQEKVRRTRVQDPDQVQKLLATEISQLLKAKAQPLVQPQKGKLLVFLVVGVNGAGKTTTIGKMAYRYKQEGWKTIIAAGDTFRAAAVEQLEVWAQRSGVSIITSQEGSDPAAVVFDAIAAATARQAEVLIIDTAGRLQNKAHLMQELAKVQRVAARELGRPLDEILLVLDAGTGQNALSQARLFSEAVPVSGVVLTKLDGTAKGGIVLAIASELGLPVKLVGLGEGIEDLYPFDADAFVRAIFP